MASRPRSGEWACSTCTFKNSCSVLQCTMCATKKAAASESAQSTWSCSACTFQNNHAETKCVVCNTSKPVLTKPQSLPPPTRMVHAASSDGFGYGAPPRQLLRRPISETQSHDDFLDEMPVGVSRQRKASRHSKQNHSLSLARPRMHLGGQMNAASAQNDLISNLVDHRLLDAPRREFEQSASSVDDYDYGIVADDLWMCTRCTLQNAKHHTECEVCGNARPVQFDVESEPEGYQIEGGGPDDDYADNDDNLDLGDAYDDDDDNDDAYDDNDGGILSRPLAIGSRQLGIPQSVSSPARHKSASFSVQSNEAVFSPSQSKSRSVSMFGPDQTMEKKMNKVLETMVINLGDKNKALEMLKRLKFITSKVNGPNARFRRLDTELKAIKKMLSHNGTLDYLQLLGFATDADQPRYLTCATIPDDAVVQTALATIEFHYQNASNDEKPSEEKENFREQMEIEQEEDLQHFTLLHLVGLVTHEIVDESTARQTLELCHKCFAKAVDLISAIRLRFFIPPPDEADGDQSAYKQWVKQVQKPVQEKCIDFLTEWINDYYKIDFQNPEMWTALEKFITEIKSVEGDSKEWYSILLIRLESSMEIGTRRQSFLDGIGSPVAPPQDQKELAGFPSIVPADTTSAIKPVDLKILRKTTSSLSSRSILSSSSRSSKSPNVSPRSSVAGASSGKHKILLTEYTPKAVAQQLTKLDYRLFRKIHSREFLEKIWKPNQKNPKASEELYPNLTKMINRFNAIHRYVIFQVLSPHSLQVRKTIITHFIEVAQELVQQQNFFSLMAIFAGLNSTAIQKLKFAWMRMELKHRQIFDHISNVCAGTSNFGRLRSHMEQCHPPAVPYVGLILQDLTFVNEGSKKHVESGFINFSRFRKFTERCLWIRSFQDCEYGFENDGALQTCIHNDIKASQKVPDKFVRLLVQPAVELDASQATKAEKKELAKIIAAKQQKNPRRGRGRGAAKQNKKGFKGWIRKRSFLNAK